MFTKNDSVVLVVIIRGGQPLFLMNISREHASEHVRTWYNILETVRHWWTWRGLVAWWNMRTHHVAHNAWYDGGEETWCQLLYRWRDVTGMYIQETAYYVEEQRVRQQSVRALDKLVDAAAKSFRDVGEGDEWKEYPDEV